MDTFRMYVNTNDGEFDSSRKLGEYADYSKALEKACEWLCDVAMLYAEYGYAEASIYRGDECIWSEAVGIDR